MRNLEDLKREVDGLRTFISEVRAALLAHHLDHEDGGGDEVNLTGLSGILQSTNVEVAELGTATYDDVQDFINMAGDRTLISGGTISDNGDGSATVAAGTAWCKETDSDTAVGKFFDFSADASVSLTDLLTNFVYVDYNGGTPQVVVATALTTHGFKQDHIFVGAIYREGTMLHFHQSENLGIGGINKTHMHFSEHFAVHRVSGMVASATGTRNLAITAGVLYAGLNRHETAPFTTPNSGTADATEAYQLHDADGGFAATDVGKRVKNTTDTTYAHVTAFVDSGQLTLDTDIFESGETYDLDTFSYWYYDGDLGTPAWVEVQGSTAISNTQYNALATGLASLTANRFGVHWVYMDNDGHHIHIVYGQGNYRANEAEEASVPASLPPVVTNYCVLIAKIICQQGTDTLTITYPWTAAFTSSLATDHGSLAGLADDDHTQYPLKSIFNAHSVMIAVSDNTPVVLEVAASRIVGRKSTGNIVALTGAEILAILSGQAGANFAWNAKKLTGVADPTANQDAATKKYHDDNLPAGGYTEGCRVYNDADFSVANATAWVVHPFNSEQYDTDTMHDNVTNNNRITFTTAGIYIVIFQVKWDANVTGRRIMGMRTNDGSLVAFDERPIPGNSTFNMTLPTLIEASATDWVEAILYQSSGAALDTKHNLPANVYFMAQRIG